MNVYHNVINNQTSNAYVFFHRLIGSDDYLYCTNAHGDVVKLVNSNGIVVKTYNYDAFGNETGLSENDSNPYRYAGEYFDKETGTIYLRARYYNPTVGRFSTVDPIRDGLNWYAYCGNSPIVFVDPWGLVLTSSEEDSEFFLNAINQITDDEIRYDPETKSYYVYKMYDTERHVGQTLVQDLIASEEVIVLQTTSDGLSYYEIESKTIVLNNSPDNQYGDFYMSEDGTQSFIYFKDMLPTQLGHEMVHAWRDLKGYGVYKASSLGEYIAPMVNPL